MQIKNQRPGSKVVRGFSFILILKGIMNNFNKNEVESKMKNFRVTNLVLQLMYEMQIKSKTVMSWTLRKKKDDIFCTVYFNRWKSF